MKYSEFKKQCPMTSARLSIPKPLPPLVSYKARVTMDPRAHLPSTWRDAIGKPLTDRRIKFYQSQGRLGGGSIMTLPPVTGPRCCSCQGVSNVKRRDYSYLPKAGYWCELCLERERNSRDKDKELARLVKERRRSYE